MNLRVVFVLLFALSFLSSHFLLPVRAQTITPQQSYFSFDAALLEVDERTLNASLSFFFVAQIDNMTAPTQLEVHGLGTDPPSFRILIPVTDRNANFAFYQKVHLFNVPLLRVNATHFPFDSYSFNISLRVVPTFLFDSNSKINVSPLNVVQSLANGLWDIKPTTKPSYFIDSERALFIKGVSASITRNRFVIEQVNVPIYGLLFILGGSMALETTRHRRKGNAANRLAVFVAAFVGLTGFSSTIGGHLPSNFALPSIAGLLIEIGEISTAIFAFVTFLDASITDSQRWALIFDSLAVIVCLAIALTIRIEIGGFFVIGFQNLPDLVKLTVVVALASGIIVRYFNHAHYRVEFRRLGPF